jgi:hypothetical protein
MRAGASKLDNLLSYFLILFFYLIFAKKTVKLLEGMARGSGARPRQCNLLKAARYGGLWCVKFVSGDTL